MNAQAPKPAKPASLMAAGTWPLLGRQQQLAAVCSLLRGPEQGGGVLITGAAGVGKTRLAREALSVISAEGGNPLWAVASRESQTISFGAVAQWFGDEWPTDIAGAFEAVRFVRANLEQLPDGVRGVLAVDDAHLLDPASIVLIQQLIGTRSASVVLTVRAEETVPETVSALWKDEMVERIEVLPLGEADTHQLLEVALGGELESTVFHSLWSRSGGNPLWLRELVLDELANDRLRQVNGEWISSGGPRPSHGSRLMELIGVRLDAADPPGREALELVALGEPLPLDLAELLIAADVLESLERTGLLRVETSARLSNVKLRHPLYGELLRERLPTLTARRLWKQLAAAVAELSLHHPVDLRRLALWHLEAELPVAPAILAAAAQQALQQADPELAERLARAGLAAAGDRSGADPADPADDDSIVDLLEIRLAEALGIRAQWLEVLELCDKLDARPLDADMRARLSLMQMWPRLFEGRVEEADRMLASVETSATEQDLRNAGTALRAAVAFFVGDLDGCRRHATRALERDNLSGLPHRWATWTLVSAESLTGRCLVAVETSEKELARMGIEDSLSLAPYEMMIGYCIALLRMGRIDEAGSVTERYHRSALELCAPNLPPIAAMLVGFAHLERGRLEEACRWLRDAITGMAKADPLRLVPMAYAELARALAMRGDADGAKSTLEEGTSIGTTFAAFTSFTDRARAWQMASAGNVRGAHELARTAADHARAIGQRGDEAVLLHDIARMGGAKSVVGDLNDLVHHHDGELVRLFAAHADALYDASAPGLEKVAQRFTDMGSLLCAAEAWLEAADHHHRRGDTRRQQACSTRSAELVAQCGEVRTPALWWGTERARLTDRELEVALLAAGGMSSRLIADQYVLSVRTIENHLHRVYYKLGITDRSMLASALDRWERS